MSFGQYRRPLVLSVVLAIACVFYLFIQPIGKTGDPDEWFLISAIGAMFVPAALLGFWTSMSALPLLIRTSSGLFAMLPLAVSFVWGIQEPSRAPQIQPAQWATAIVIQFFLTFAVFSVFRWLFRWELRSPDMPERRGAGQFSILAILIWTLEAALLVALLRYCFQVGRIEGQPEELWAKLTKAAMQGLLLAAVGLTSIPIAWLILARGWTQLVGAILTTIALALLAVVAATSGSSSYTGLIEGAILTSGLAVMSLIILLGIRLAGDRLVRAPRRPQSARDDGS